MRGFLSLAAATLIGTASAALQPVTVKGNAFFVGDERVSLPPVTSCLTCSLPRWLFETLIVPSLPVRPPPPPFSLPSLLSSAY